MTPNWQLTHDAFGYLCLTTADGHLHQHVVTVRAFPIAQADQGIALLSAEGHELAWIDQLSDLDAPLRALIENELARREFVPEIERIISVSTFATPSVWQIDTHRGRTHLTLKGEEDIRRLSASMLLIADAHGIEFLIRDLHRLDAASRRLLDRFL